MEGKGRREGGWKIGKNLQFMRVASLMLKRHWTFSGNTLVCARGKGTEVPVIPREAVSASVSAWVSTWVLGWRRSAPSRKIKSGNTNQDFVRQVRNSYQSYRLPPRLLHPCLSICLSLCSYLLACLFEIYFFFFSSFHFPFSLAIGLCQSSPSRDLFVSPQAVPSVCLCLLRHLPFPSRLPILRF